MTSVESVVPNSLNYTDIKPQAIENEIKLVRFQPTSTVTGARGGDMIKFLLSGNGFLDPYSTYFQFTVECTDLDAGEIRWLDRSAHSFFQRIIIRSQGVEIERIENYDMIAAMINDMIYSPEQASLHYWEGFGRHSIQTQDVFPALTNYTAPGMLLHQGSSPSELNFIGETCFHRGVIINTPDANQLPHGALTIPSKAQLDDANLDYDDYDNDEKLSAVLADGNFVGKLNGLAPMMFDGHERGIRVVRQEPSDDEEAKKAVVKPVVSIQFIVPIYSGVLGLLMPEKKLIPLNLLPLDIEIVFNPHALYSNFPAPGGGRGYTVTKFNLMANMIFFEQEIHRTLEASVADHGLFLYCNSFHTAPQQLISGDAPPSVAYISMNLKSINSIHTVFMYNHFETMPCARKLHFVSHNVNKLQLLNGTQLIPQYAIEGSSGSSIQGEHLPYLVELYKAWNKLHDPTTDGAICAWNFCGDDYGTQFDAIEGSGEANDPTNSKWLTAVLSKQAYVGRCQFGISLEGEELGTDKTMITGRKSQYPFLLQMHSDRKTSTHTSYMYTFLRADFIIYIRPDLQIVTLGK